MKVDGARIDAIARAWPDSIRLMLFYGPDLSAARDLADEVARRCVDPSNPMAVETLTGDRLKGDSQALVAAAAAMSMFGDRVLVRVDGIDDDGVDAVNALVAGPPGNPVVAVAKALKKGSKLQALAERSGAIAALPCYEPSLRDALRLVSDIGQAFGLKSSREAAAALFEACGGDRMIIRREVEKLSLYLDTSPAAPRTLELADVMAVGVGAGDADQYALVAAVSGGKLGEVGNLLGRQSAAGIVMLRAVERRLLLLLSLRAAVDAGTSPKTVVDGARPPIFWKEKDAVAADLAHWTTPALVQGLADLLAAERAIKTSGSLGETLADAALLTLARRAAVRRR